MCFFGFNFLAIGFIGIFSQTPALECISSPATQPCKPKEFNSLFHVFLFLITIRNFNKLVKQICAKSNIFFQFLAINMDYSGIINTSEFNQRYFRMKIEKFLPNNEPQSILNFPFYWVTQVNGKYLQLMEKSIKKLGLDNTKRKIILSTNSVGEASITEIANLALLKLTTTTKAVDRLVEDGILEVSSSESDERISVVKLTPKGLELVAQLNQIIQVTLSGVLQQFSEAELLHLNQQLQKLADLIPSN